MISAYNWYYRETEFRPPKINNFCQFCRIVFLWAPGLWVIQALLNLLIRLSDFLVKPVIGKLPTWGVLAIAAYAVILALESFWVIIITGIALLIGLLAYLFTQDGFVRVMRFLLNAVLVILVVVFFGFSIFWIATNWTKFLDSLILALQIIMAFGLIILAVVVLYLGIRAAFGAVVNWIHQRRYSRSRKASPRPSKQILRNLKGVVSLGWHWLVILKRKTICPWVEFTKDGHINFSFSADHPDLTKKVAFGG